MGERVCGGWCVWVIGTLLGSQDMHGMVLGLASAGVREDGVLAWACVWRVV